MPPSAAIFSSTYVNVPFAKVWISHVCLNYFVADILSTNPGVLTTTSILVIALLLFQYPPRTYSFLVLTDVIFVSKLPEVTLLKRHQVRLRFQLNEEQALRMFLSLTFCTSCNV